jgi:hypothetical protein
MHHIMLQTIEFIDLLNVLWAKPTINPTVSTYPVLATDPQFSKFLVVGTNSTGVPAPIAKKLTRPKPQ